MFGLTAQHRRQAMRSRFQDWIQRRRQQQSAADVAEILSLPRGMSGGATVQVYTEEGYVPMGAEPEVPPSEVVSIAEEVANGVPVAADAATASMVPAIPETVWGLPTWLVAFGALLLGIVLFGR